MYNSSFRHPERSRPAGVVVEGPFAVSVPTRRVPLRLDSLSFCRADGMSWSKWVAPIALIAPNRRCDAVTAVTTHDAPDPLLRCERITGRGCQPGGNILSRRSSTAVLARFGAICRWERIALRHNPLWLVDSLDNHAQCCGVWWPAIRERSAMSPSVILSAAKACPERSRGISTPLAATVPFATAMRSFAALRTTRACQSILRSRRSDP